MWNYTYTDELYHYGVPGMKWGVRNARQEVRAARKALRKEKRQWAGLGVGIEGIARYQAKANRVGAATAKLDAAKIDLINEKAKYNASKAKNEKKAAKAEFNTYYREMRKGGLVGSIADANSGGKATRAYNAAMDRKGKAYADKVQKKIENRVIAKAVALGTVAVGSAIVTAILEKNG